MILEYRDCVIAVSTGAGHPMISYSMNLNSCGFPVLVSLGSKEKILGIEIHNLTAVRKYTGLVK